jgi:hypothetical protein
MKNELQKFFQNNKVQIFLTFWLLAIGYGMYLVINHANKPAQPAIVSALWPTTSKLVLAKDRPTVVLFAHPKCPCTRATIGELALLATQTQNKAKMYVLFTKPMNLPDEWQQTDIWDSAKLISGVEVISDPEGEEATFFQAFTSGQTLVYNPQGKLLFSGGITSARGHSGDNVGRSTITNIINNNNVTIQNTPVFGCTLCLPNTDKNTPKLTN